MVFPDPRVELQIDGTWTDVTADALREDGGIRYRWGRRAEGSRTEPATATFSLFNPDGKYSSRNPTSPYYGKIGRNTPVRLSHSGADVALVIPAGETARATTPDVAALDLAGNLDARADLTPAQWGGTTSLGGWEVMGKSFDVGQISWILLITDLGRIQLRWSATGVTQLIETSDMPVSFAPGQRGAIRATLDIDNGAGGHTVRFYTAATLAGTWVQLGTPQVTAGVTSIFNSTAPLYVGDIDAFVLEDIYREIHAIEVRAGIGGPAVANPDFAAQASGTTSFTDAAGRVWSLTRAAITSRRTRAVLEAASWTPQWGAGGMDVTTPVVAAGILRRLGQGSGPLASALRRRIPTGGPIAYWPLEDERDATQAASPIVGCPPLRCTDVSFAQDDTCPGSAALPTVGAAALMQARVPISPNLGWTFSMIYWLEAPPAGTNNFLGFTCTGTAAHGIALSFTNPNIVADFYDTTGTLITSTSFSNAGLTGQWIRVDYTGQYIGPHTNFTATFVAVDGSTQALSTTAIAGTPGYIKDISTGFGAQLSGMRVGHLALFDSPAVSIWNGSESGYTGETTGERIIRLGTEESVPVSVADSDGIDTAMGAQRPNTLLDLFAECETSDGGILYEDRFRAALAYRTRTTLYNQDPKVTIAYSQLVTPLEPTDDDQQVRNDRTVRRDRGSSARAVLTSGVLSTALPPAGVGLYDDSTTVSVASDDQLQDIADWLLHRGTWDESRYPRVRILLHKYPALVPAVCALQPGDVLRITDLPAWLPPGPLDLLVEGAEEEIRSLEWTITLSCSPAGPWNVGVTDDEVRGKADTGGSTLGAAATSSATTLVVHTTQTADGMSPYWTEDAAEYPFDLKVGGEVVTASASAPLVRDTFTRTVAAGGWGTSSDGHTYTAVGGLASDRSVAATYGLITLAATPTSHRYMTVAETCADCDLRASIAFSATATGGSLAASVIGRWTSSSDYYRIRVEGTTAGGITLTVTRGTTIVGSSVGTGVTYTPGSIVEVRMRIVGDRILGRVWATGTTEPLTWHIDETITSSPIASGQVGLAGSALTGNSNVNPEVRFHDWAIETPQKVTVTRSVNGVVKAQAASTSISLAHPAIVTY